MNRILTALILTAGLGTAAHAQSVPQGFTVESYAGGIAMGTTMAWTPDGRLLVAQLNGTIRVVKDGALLGTPFHTVTVDSPPGTERGLLGMCLDPDFASNGYVYVYFTDPTPVPHNVIRRLRASPPTADVSDGSATPIVDLEPLGPDTMHNGGSIAFGSDGALYVAVGDNGDANHAQSLMSRFGKILRYNADGSIPGNNPSSFPGIPGTTAGDFRAIWAVGLRNPYRFAFQPGTSRMFINDVGVTSWEEINSGAAGLNYGWTGGDTDGARGMPGFTDPVYQYGHAGSAPSGGAITGGVFYNPTRMQYPASYRSRYFFADYVAGFIYTLNPDAPGSAEQFLLGASGPVDLSVGPDGALYYLAATGNAGVFRVSYSGPGGGASGAASTGSGGGGSSGGGGCGLVGLEAAALAALLRRRRKEQVR